VLPAAVEYLGGGPDRGPGEPCYVAERRHFCTSLGKLINRSIMCVEYDTGPQTLSRDL
jgi:hypothetical protein